MGATTLRRYRRPNPGYRINAYQASAMKPLSEISVTPLIHVMLLLLALLVMAVPLATHKTPVNLPATDGRSLPEMELTIEPSGRVFWNGAAFDRPALRHHLASDAAQVIALTGEARIKNLTFIGNEQFRTFGR